MSKDFEDYINIADPVAEICQKFDLIPAYVARLDIEPGLAKVELYRGKEGRCQGAKYITEDGEPAMETLEFKVFT